MSESRLRRSATAVAALALIAVLTPTAAMAEGGDASTTTISALGGTDFDYSSNWVAVAKVSRVESKRSVTTADGTVDVYADGGALAVAEDLPIQADGSVYITQSTAAPLAAGEHTLTAVFHPSADSELQSSQSAEPLSIRINPLTIEPSAKLVGWGDQPGSISLDVVGTYLDAHGVPGGTWTVAVTSSAGVSAGSQTIPQSAGATMPFSVPVEATLERGEDYTVSAAFTPDASIAGGVSVAAVPAMSASTQPVTTTEVLNSAIPLDPMVIGVFAAAAVLILLALALLIALARVRGARPGNRVVAAEEANAQLVP
ncbi:hypothetical protein [Naasia lichenicola]|uniref:Ig-like domain repeat protein n=1 Tax=Naasia lichenicola TaxID=2565933 RepID=A0A4S4FJF6_9MICO|nr:hypothetical protein [Naasia lichenicola]THG29365.1 hypothetical protein E6C64_11665 [Naasia lichenicola]